MKNNLLFKSFIFFIIFNLGNFLSFIFQFTLARVLSVDDFGTYNTLIALSTLISFPTIIILFLVSSETTNIKFLKLKITILENILLCFFISIFFTITFYLFLNQIMNYLKIYNYLFLFLIFSTSLISIFASVFVGIAQGKSNYIHQSLIQTSPLFFRLIFLIILCYLLSFDLVGALFSNLLSTFVAIILGIFFYKKLFKFNLKHLFYAKNFVYKIPYFKILVYFLNSILILIILNIDVIIIKHFSTEFQTGLYTSSALLAKIIFFLTLFLTNINFRETSALENTKFKKIFINSISFIFILICSYLLFLLFNFYSDLIFKFTFGSEYSKSSIYFNNQLIHYTLLSFIALLCYICVSYNIFLNLILSIVTYFIFFIIINQNISLDIFSILTYLIFADLIVFLINIPFLIYLYFYKI